MMPLAARGAICSPLAQQRGGTAAPAWTPASLPGIVYWNEPRLETAYGDTDPVPLASNFAAETPDLVEMQSNFNPAYRTGIVKGNPVLRFDGTDDALQFSGGGITQVLPINVWAVFRQDGSDYRVLLNRNHDAAPAFYAHIPGVYGGPTIYWSGMQHTWQGAFNQGLFYVVHARITGVPGNQNVDVFLNGAYDGHTSNYGGSIPPGSVWSHVSLNWIQQFVGDIAAIIICNGATVSDEDAALCDAYLMEAYIE